jgi:hypothetical protein
MMLLKIAEIVFSITCDIPYQSILPGDPYESFLSAARPDVRIRFLFKGKVDFRPRREDKLISKGSFSGLYCTDGGAALISGPPTGPHLVVFFKNNFCDVEAFFSHPWRDGGPPEVLSYLPEYPPLRLALNAAMARRGGLLVHGCGIVDKGKGYLFTGHSDHGKSTMARLWGDKAVVLGDEFTVLVDRDGRFRIYGTPWPGDYSKVSYGGAPLNKVFFLHPSDKNVARPVRGATAGAMLLARSFAPVWERTGMESTLDTVTRLLQEVPCYDLGFFPDQDVVDYVRGLE